MKKIGIILIALSSLLLGCSEEVPETEGSVSGFVKDASTDKPLSAAAVLISPTNATTVTGADGSYTFQGLMSGQYKIQVTKSDYKTNSRQITVVPGQNTPGDIQLTEQINLASITLSTSILDFGASDTELIFNINNVNSSGAATWTISDVSSPIESVAPMSGTTNLGQSSSVKVTIDRSKVSGNENTSFIINVTDGGSLSMKVKAEI